MWECIGDKASHVADCAAAMPILLAATGLVPEMSAVIGLIWYVIQILQSDVVRKILAAIAGTCVLCALFRRKPKEPNDG